jgi:hypothetical protein
VPVGALRLHGEAAFDQRDGVVAPALLMRQDAGEVEGVGVIWSGVEDAAVDVGGGRELVVLVQDERDRQRFAEAERAVAARAATRSLCSP